MQEPKFSNVSFLYFFVLCLFVFVPLDNWTVINNLWFERAAREQGWLGGRVADLWSKGLRSESLQEWWDNFLLQGQLPVLTLISVSVPPHVTAVARKRSWSFCQKCRWQVTAKHAYTFCICGFAWSDMVHGCMVYTEQAKTAISCGTSHGSTISTPLQWIFQKCTIKS